MFRRRTPYLASSRPQPSPARATLMLAAAVIDFAPYVQASEVDHAALYAKVDQIFADYAIDQHIPGMVYGIVADGKLIYVRGVGVQDLESKRPVTPDTLFRIASMSKAFADGAQAARCGQAAARRAG